MSAYLKQAAADQVFDRMSDADAQDLNWKVSGMVFLRACGGGVSILLLAISTYQATWALLAVSGQATGNGIYGGGIGGLTADQWALGATAFGLVFAAQIVAVRLIMASGIWLYMGVALLFALMSFSGVTSAMHVGFNVEGGVIESTRQTDEYKLAKARYESAIASKTTAAENWAGYQDKARQGTVDQSGWMLRDAATMPYRSAISGADAEVEDARRAFEQVKEGGGGGSAMAGVIGAIAGWFGTDTAGFAMGFGVFVVVLMEATRVYLSLLAGLYLMQLMKTVGEQRQAKAAQEAGGQAKVEPAAKAPAKAMASTLDKARDTVKGPALNDPINVEDRPQLRKGSGPADRAPANKRQAAYSQKLAKLKQAITSGTIAPGQGITVAEVERITGGNRDTIGALRRDVALAGLAHWQGKRLVAGGR